MRKICDTEELRKALEAADLLQFLYNIRGEDVKQDDGSWLHTCEYTLKPNVDFDTASKIEAVFQAQQKRDWKSWRVASDKLKEIEQKSGTVRKDRDLNLKVFGPNDFQFKSAKLVEDQLQPLRDQMRKA